MGDWLTVKSKLPEKHEDVLVFSQDDGITIGFLSAIDDEFGCEWFIPDRDEVSYHISHWMPLPVDPLHIKHSNKQE